jgi:hypothetical protein
MSPHSRLPDQRRFHFHKTIPAFPDASEVGRTQIFACGTVGRASDTAAVTADALAPIHLPPSSTSGHLFAARAQVKRQTGRPDRRDTKMVKFNVVKVRVRKSENGEKKSYENIGRLILHENQANTGTLYLNWLDGDFAVFPFKEEKAGKEE